MNDINNINDYINSKIELFEKIAKDFKSILHDEKIKQIVNNVLSFNDPMFYTYDSFACKNNLLFSPSIEESVYFEFDFKKTSENKEIFCDLYFDRYGCIMGKFYFIKDNHKYYSYNCEIFQKEKNLIYSSSYCDEIKLTLPESCKDINEKIANAFELLLNNSNDINKFKNIKFKKKDKLAKMLEKKVDERLSKEIFK